MFKFTNPKTGDTRFSTFNEDILNTRIIKRKMQIPGSIQYLRPEKELINDFLSTKQNEGNGVEPIEVEITINDRGMDRIKKLIGKCNVNPVVGKKIKKLGANLSKAFNYALSGVCVLPLMKKDSLCNDCINKNLKDYCPKNNPDSCGFYIKINRKGND